MGFPLSSSFPGPTAMTFPFVGFSFAVSGRRIPLLVFSSASDCFTITRSCNGFSFIVRYLFVVRAYRPPFGFDFCSVGSAHRALSWQLRRPLHLWQSPAHVLFDRDV